MIKNLIILTCFLLSSCTVSAPINSAPPAHNKKAEVEKPKAERPEVKKITKEEPISDAISIEPKSPINWSKISNESLIDAVKNYKFVMVYLYADNCEDCALYESITLNDEYIARVINNRFIPIKVNRIDEDAKQYMEALDSPIAYPTIMFLTPTGNLVGALSGFFPPEPFSLILEQLIDVLDDIKHNNEKEKDTLLKP